MPIADLLKAAAIAAVMLWYSGAVIAIAYAALGQGWKSRIQRAAAAAAALAIFAGSLWTSLAPFLRLWVDFDFLLYNGYLGPPPLHGLLDILSPLLISLAAAAPPAALLRAAYEREWLSRRLIVRGAAGTMALLAAADLALAAAGARLTPGPSWEIPRLAKTLESSDPLLRARALDVLRSRGSAAEAAIPAFREILLTDPALGSAASAALAALGPAGLPALVDALRHEKAQVRRNAAARLAVMGSASAPALHDLIDAADDPDPHVRWNVYKALAAIGPAARPAVPGLVRDLGATGGADELRHAAAKALTAIGPACLPALLPLLRGENGVNLGGRYIVIDVIGGFGPAARPALPALRKIQADPKSKFRDQAARAVRRIEGRNETVAPGRPKN